MTKNEVVKKLKALADTQTKMGMVRFGINPKGTLGVTVPKLRKLAKEIGCDHDLALALWESKIHEAMILATMIADKKLLTQRTADAWVLDMDSWDTCDMACMNVLRYTPFAWKKVGVWVKSKKEFVRRAGFALVATLAVGDKQASDEQFIKIFPLIKKYSTDERNFVKKAVNWALRQIGKRNINLNKKARLCAQELLKIDSKSARWIAGDAIRELTDAKTVKMVEKRKANLF